MSSSSRGPRNEQALPVAFVLGGGGHLGAYQVGMLRALIERGIRPDVVVGTSVGAMNGAAVAADPSIDTVTQLESIWSKLDQEPVFAASLFAGAARLARSRTHVQPIEPLRDLIERMLPARSFDELKVRFECVAACIERAAEHWFSTGLLVQAILASAAVPGILPPVEIDGEHYVDGGIVNSIPIERAVQMGADVIYVLHVGRVDRKLEAPRNVIEVAMVAFEIARRHRFARDMASLPDGVVAHVLPTGEEKPPRFSDLSQLRYRDFSDVAKRIAGAYGATQSYLDQAGVPAT
jgi:NTE family protein